MIITNHFVIQIMNLAIRKRNDVISHDHMNSIDEKIAFGY